MEKRIRMTIPPQLHLLPESAADRVAENVAAILSTKCGECPLDRTFGLPQNYVGKPMQVAETMLVAEVLEALEREPHAELISATFDITAAGKLVPVVEVKINV